MKLFIILLFSMFLIGCSNSENRGEVSLALDWYPNSNHAGIYSAIDEGFLKKKT